MGNLICGEVQMGAEFGRCNCRVTQLLADPERRVVISGSADGKLREWPVDGERPAQPRDFTCPLFSPAEVSALVALDSNVLASGHLDGKVFLWLAQRRTLQRVLEGPPRCVIGLAWHPPSRTLISADVSGACHQWTLQGNAAERAAHPAEVSPGARQALAFLGDMLFRIVNPKLGPGHVIEGVHLPSPVSEDNCSDRGGKRKPGPSEDAPLILVGHMDTIRIVTTHAGYLYSAADDMVVRRWSAAGDCVGVFRGARRPLTSLAFANSRLFVGSEDLSVREWGTGSKDPSAVFIHGAPLVALAVCHQWLIAASQDGYLRVLEVQRSTRGGPELEDVVAGRM
eukprot:EG_transcript_16280